MFKAMECLCLLSGYWAGPQCSQGLEKGKKAVPGDSSLFSLLKC